MAGLAPVTNPALDAGEIEINVQFLDPGQGLLDVNPGRISTHCMGDTVRSIEQSAEWHGCGPPAKLDSILFVCRFGEEPLTSQPAAVAVPGAPPVPRPIAAAAADQVPDALTEAETILWSGLPDLTAADIQALKTRRLDRSAAAAEMATEWD